MLVPWSFPSGKPAFACCARTGGLLREGGAGSALPPAQRQERLRQASPNPTGDLHRRARSRLAGAARGAGAASGILPLFVAYTLPATRLGAMDARRDRNLG